MASGVGCLSRKGWWDFKKNDPDSPVSRVKHACEGVERNLHRQFLTPVYHQRWP